MEENTWICLDCARAGGRRERCMVCEYTRPLTLREKSDAAVRELTRAWMSDRTAEDVRFEEQNRKWVRHCRVLL